MLEEGGNNSKKNHWSEDQTEGLKGNQGKPSNTSLYSKIKTS
jgi:hypothetical protein